MDKKKEEFLVQLRDTFREEASEHLAAITAGLVAIERADDDERASIVERVFREAHSLKGAARSVSLPSVETLCQELERIFAAIQHEELKLSTTMLDSIHVALEILVTLCGDPCASPSPESKGKELQACAALKQIVEGAKVLPTETPVAATTAPRIVAARGAAPSERDTVRVSTRKLDAILLEAEELVGAKLAGIGRAAELRMLAADLADWNRQRVRRSSRKRRGCDDTGESESIESEMLYTRTLENSLRKMVETALEDALSLAAITTRLLENTKKLLLLPCSYLLGAFPKVLRDLAREQGKEAELLVEGEDIEIDRRVLDELKDPLIHLLRNCVDHGIEKPDERLKLGKQSCGSVTISVKTMEGNLIELTVSDDGAGIEADKVRKAAVRMNVIAAEEAASLTEADATRLIFYSGLSTSPIITDLSGRGLGLAIVQEKVEKLGGTVSVTSTPGAGTTFRLIVPISQVTFRGVLVSVVGRHFVFPTSNVVRVSRVKSGEIKTIENRQTIAVGDEAMSLVRLRDVLELSGQDGCTNGNTRQVVVVRAVDRQIAFLVDEVLGEQEVLVKSLGRQLTRVRHIASASISGNGTVIPILNVADLVYTAITGGAPGSISAVQDAAPEPRRRLLIAEDSITARTLVKNILEGAGYEVTTAVDGMDALTRLKSESFNLLVSDVDMPRMNGFELTAKIRADKRLGELPVVLVTALGSQKDREYGIEVGANAYIVKSDFDQGNLLEIIRRFL
jgi:two-component system chemotaxis sensor kinase CheA